MELTVLDLELIEALQSEINKVKQLTSEITSPYHALHKQEEHWLDGPEVCQLLGISNRTLQSYRTKNILPSTQICRKNFSKTVDIKKLLEERTISRMTNPKELNP